MLHDRALLVTLTISQWGARKYDAGASKEVAKQHQADNAGRFNKLLIDTSFLKPIAQSVNALRTYHYERTLPWTDEGRRLLPSALYFDYTKKMRELKEQFNLQVMDFCSKYQGIVAAERKRLGTLYDPSDYPQNIRSKFDVAIYPEPVPSGGDLRVDIGADIDKVRSEIEAATQERLKNAMGDCWTRVREVVQNVQTRLDDPKAIFRDSLITNVSDLIDILGALNVDNDPQLDMIRVEMKGLVRKPHQIRSSPGVRAETAAKAAEILAKLPWK